MLHKIKYTSSSRRFLHVTAAKEVSSRLALKGYQGTYASKFSNSLLECLQTIFRGQGHEIRIG